MVTFKSVSLTFLFILLIGTVVVGAVSINDFYKKTAPSSCEEFTIRNRFIWLPGKVSDLFHDDRIILHFAMINANEITVNGIVRDNAIAGLECGRSEPYDFEVWMSDLNALELATSARPITTFVRLWRNGEMKVQPNGKQNEAKLQYADQLVAQDNEPVPEWIRVIFGKYLE